MQQNFFIIQYFRGRCQRLEKIYKNAATSKALSSELKGIDIYVAHSENYWLITIKLRKSGKKP